ncbi:MAG: histidine kinase N-terminal 7TM domain-containing protein [Haloarculaceae archaeon]
MGTLVLSLITAGSVAGGVTCLGLAVLAWRNRTVPGAASFAGLTTIGGVWALLYALRLVASDPTTVYLLGRISRAISVNIPPLWLVFALVYTGNEKWVTRRSVAALWVFPVVYILLTLTAPLHGLGDATVTSVTANGQTLLVPGRGAVYHVGNVVSYVYLIAAYLVLLVFLGRSQNIYRRQTAAIIFGSLFPAVMNTLFVLGIRPHPGIELTPMTFVFFGIAVSWALFRYDFLNVTPLVSDMLVDQLPDPVFVLDPDRRVVEHNPAAQTAVGDDDISGEHIESVLPGLFDRVESDEVFSLAGTARSDGGEIKFYDPRVTEIDDQHDNTCGELVVLRDVTGQQRRQDRLEALQTATQEFIRAGTEDEIARLAVDFADGVLDQHAATVFLREDGWLRPAAVSDGALELHDESELIIDDHEHVIWQAYEHEERRFYDIESDPDAQTPFSKALLLPLGEHGILGIGTLDSIQEYAPEDRQFAQILARTTQVALDQVQREHELRRSQTSLERRNEQLAFFNGVLRHALRNALLVIRGRAEMLRETVTTDEHGHLDRIVEWCEDLSELSEQIRAINDTVTATETERLETVALDDLIRERVAEIERDHEEATISLDLRESESVLANDLAGEVIDSVVLNAINHNDTDEPQIEITTQRAADWIQVRVADDGPGITDEMKETVFERDIGTDQSAEGFGLYFVSVMMDLYGGKVWFEDNDPRGAVAVLEFQIADTGGSAETKGTSSVG